MADLQRPLNGASSSSVRIFPSSGSSIFPTKILSAIHVTAAVGDQCSQCREAAMAEGEAEGGDSDSASEESGAKKEVRGSLSHPLHVPSPPLPLSSPINSVSLRLPPGRHGATRRGFLGGTAKRYSAWSKWLASNLGRRLDVEAGNDRKLHFRSGFLSQI